MISKKNKQTHTFPALMYDIHKYTRAECVCDKMCLICDIYMKAMYNKINMKLKPLNVAPV